MLQILSFAMFTAVLLVSLAVIVATVKAELSFILRALRIEPRTQLSPLPDGGRRVRVVRQARLAPSVPGLRAAA